MVIKRYAIMNKRFLIAEICKLAPHYSFGDNREYLYSMDADELLDEYNCLNTMKGNENG